MLSHLCEVHIRGSTGLTKLLRMIGSERSAVTSLEFALIAALVALVMVTGVRTYGSKLGSAYSNYAADIPTN